LITDVYSLASSLAHSSNTPPHARTKRRVRNLENGHQSIRPAPRCPNSPARRPALDIEECFQRAKEELGLDHSEARSWHAWHRHMTLCMTAVAFLARLTAQLREAAGRKENQRSPAAHAA
jgi:hypothetical protein